MGKAVYRLDGDNLRHGLNSDLDFPKRTVMRIYARGGSMRAFVDAGLIVLVSFISPLASMRSLARAKQGTALLRYMLRLMSKHVRKGIRRVYIKRQERERSRILQA